MRHNLYKVQTYLPESHVTQMKDGLNEVITPIFEGYDYVFATTPITGSWRPLEGSNAFQGTLGKIETAPEIKLEFTINRQDINKVFDKIKELHPYEKPVIEAFEVFLA